MFFFVRQMLFTIVKKSCYQNLRMHMDKVLADLIPEDETTLKDEHLRNLFFGNYMLPDADIKIYDEVRNNLKIYCFAKYGQRQV